MFWCASAFEGDHNLWGRGGKGIKKFSQMLFKLKNLRWGEIIWIIQRGLKCNHLYPFKRETDILPHTEEKMIKRRSRERFEGAL